MKKVLIYYRYFNLALGGGEFLPLTFISELQSCCEVTLALDWKDNFEHAVKTLEIPIDMNRLNIVKVMPENFHGTRNSALLSFRRFRRLKKLAKNADVCISMANIMDFGKPAHHFMISVETGDSRFMDFIKTRRISPPSFREAVRLFADQILRRLMGMRTKRQIICDPAEHIYPNSNFVDSLLHEFYGNVNTTLFYPPTIFQVPPAKTARDPLKVVYLGRVVSSKRISDIITIVNLARKRSGKNLTLSIAGKLADIEFRRKLEQLTAGMDWVDFPGKKFGREKEDFLLSGTYAVHAMREEAFGISITEYLKAGLIPIVPDEGGSCEVVSQPELTYRTLDDAAEILVRLLNDESFRERQRTHCRQRADYFSAEAYGKRQHEILQKIIGS